MDPRLSATLVPNCAATACTRPAPSTRRALSRHSTSTTSRWAISRPAAVAEASTSVVAALATPTPFAARVMRWAASSALAVPPSRSASKPQTYLRLISIMFSILHHAIVQYTVIRCFSYSCYSCSG